MVNKKRLIRTTRKLISINSENPPGSELAIARWVGGYLERLGLKVEYREFSKGRTNVIGVLKGGGRKKGLLLSPHLDTVPAGKSWSIDPFRGAVRGDRIYGLGATDCKGNLASCLEAVNSLIEDGFEPDADLTIAATADEECGSRLGMVPLIKEGTLRPDGAVVLDGENFEILVAQKGLLHLKIKVPGKRAHGAYPERGMNAIEAASRIICSLKEMGFSHKRHGLLKGPTVNIGTIKGGEKVNIVADRCEFEADIRFLPGMKASNIIGRVEAAAKRIARGSTVEVTNLHDPYEMDVKGALVRSLLEALRVGGRRPKIAGSEGATVMTFFGGAGIPAVGFGFGAKGRAHTTDEFVGISDLYKGAKLLVNFIKSFDAHRQKEPL